MLLGTGWATMGIAAAVIAASTGLPTQTFVEIAARVLLIVLSTTAGGVVRICRNDADLPVVTEQER